MERAEIHDLSAAYALDALDADELEAFEEHLARCAECRENVASFQAASAELAYDVEAPAPSPALRDRILDQAAASGRRSSRSPRRRWALPVAATAAVAAGIAALALAFWAADLSQQVDDLQAQQHRAEEVASCSRTPSGADRARRRQRRPRGRHGDAGGPPGHLRPRGGPRRAHLRGVGDRGRPGRPRRPLLGRRGRPDRRAPAVPVPEGAIVAVTVEQAGGVDQSQQQPVITSEPAV